jgi:hypothetical protein
MGISGVCIMFLLAKSNIADFLTIPIWEFQTMAIA